MIQNTFSGGKKLVTFAYTAICHNVVISIFVIINTFCILIQEEFEDTKEVIRIGISKKNRQHNGQKKKFRRTNNDLQNIHIKLKIE